MSSSRPRLWRVFGASAFASVGLYSVLTFASAPATVLAAGCSKLKPQADTAVTQSAVGTFAGAVAQSVTFAVTAENEGPCAASGVTVVDTVADTGVTTPLTITLVSANPSNAPCVDALGNPLPVGGSTTGGSISCTFPKLSAPSDASTKNPGTGVVTFSVSNPAGLGGAGAPPVTSVAGVSAASPATASADPDLGNNTSRGAFLVDGGTLSFPGFQTTTVQVPSGVHGSGEIESDLKDPNPPKGSFSQIVLINSDSFLDPSGNPASPVQTVTFDVPITAGAPQSAAKVQVWHELDGSNTWGLPLSPCTNSSVQPDPTPSCVESVTKLKGGPTGSYFEIVVLTTVTSKWIS